MWQESRTEVEFHFYGHFDTNNNKIKPHALRTLYINYSIISSSSSLIFNNFFRLWIHAREHSINILILYGEGLVSFSWQMQRLRPSTIIQYFPSFFPLHYAQTHIHTRAYDFK
jgi:hypothetical protein